MERLRAFLAEDLGFGDITTELTVPDVEGKAIIRCEAQAVLAGAEEAAIIFEDDGLEVELLADDGDDLVPGQEIMEVEGLLSVILSRERTALNMLMQMSGVATMTDAALRAARKTNPDIVIAGTRKTTPGFRFFQKKAIMLGGGDPHRYGLYDHILIKDNHIRACGGISEAMELAADAPMAYKVEIEVESKEDALLAASLGADIVLLDNMTPAQALKVRKSLLEDYPEVLVEISGNVTMDNVADYAPAADVISMGALTHSSPAIHFSLNLL